MFSIRLIKFLIVPLFIVNTIACKKDHVRREPQNENPDSTHVLMNTGHYWSTANGGYQAVYWLDSKIFPLAQTDAKSAYAYGLEIHGKDKYIAGSFTAGLPTDQTFPCYWKNGIKFNLPTDKFAPFYVCGARSVKYHDDKLYILGTADQRPVLWIVAAGQIEYFPIDSHDYIRTSSNFAIYNNTVYIGGAKDTEVGNSKETAIGYWTVNAQKQISWKAVEDHIPHATAFTITMSNGKPTLAGERKIDASTHDAPIISLWNDQGWVNVTPLSNEEKKPFRFSEVHLTKDGYFLMNVWAFSYKRPTLWKMTASGLILETTFPEVEAGKESHIASVALMGDKLGLAGYYVENGQYRLWINREGKYKDAELPERTSVSFGSAAWVENNR